MLLFLVKLRFYLHDLIFHAGIILFGNLWFIYGLMKICVGILVLG